MTAIETLSEFIDQIRNCIAEIRACNPSQVSTFEKIAIRAETGIEFAFPHLYAVLQVAQKLSLKDLFELIDAFAEKYQFIHEKKIETANLAAVCQKNNSDGKHSNGKVVNHREKNWTNKALARDKALCAIQKITWLRGILRIQAENNLSTRRIQRRERLLPKRKKVTTTR